MELDQFAYLVSILLFAGIAVFIEAVFAAKHIKRYKAVLVVVALVGIIFTLITEPIALRWHIWEYNPELTLGIWVFGAAFETFIYATVVAIAISVATLVWSDYEDAGLSPVKGTWIKLKEKLTMRGKEWQEQDAFEDLDISEKEQKQAKHARDSATSMRE